MNTTLSDPWRAFLEEIDAVVDEEMNLPICGGFAMTEYYGMQRMTLDLDVMDVAPHKAASALLALAGKGTPLSRKHRRYIDVVGIVQPPYEYVSRLQEAFAGTFKHLRLKIFDPYDIVLVKLERSSDRDFGDFLYLARTIPLDMEILRSRYHEELRPYLMGRPSDVDFTLKAWIESALAAVEVTG